MTILDLQIYIWNAIYSFTRYLPITFLLLFISFLAIIVVVKSLMKSSINFGNTKTRFTKVINIKSYNSTHSHLITFLLIFVFLSVWFLARPYIIEVLASFFNLQKENICLALDPAGLLAIFLSSFGIARSPLILNNIKGSNFQPMLRLMSPSLPFLSLHQSEGLKYPILIGQISNEADNQPYAWMAKAAKRFVPIQQVVFREEGFMANSTETDLSFMRLMNIPFSNKVYMNYLPNTYGWTHSNSVYWFRLIHDNKLSYDIYSYIWYDNFTSSYRKIMSHEMLPISNDNMPGPNPWHIYRPQDSLKLEPLYTNTLDNMLSRFKPNIIFRVYNENNYRTLWDISSIEKALKGLEPMLGSNLKAGQYLYFAIREDVDIGHIAWANQNISKMVRANLALDVVELSHTVFSENGYSMISDIQHKVIIDYLNVWFSKYTGSMFIEQQCQKLSFLKTMPVMSSDTFPPTTILPFNGLMAADYCWMLPFKLIEPTNADKILPGGIYNPIALDNESVEQSKNNKSKELTVKENSKKRMRNNNELPPAKKTKNDSHWIGKKANIDSRLDASGTLKKQARTSRLPSKVTRSLKTPTRPNSYSYSPSNLLWGASNLNPNQKLIQDSKGNNPNTGANNNLSIRKCFLLLPFVMSSTSKSYVLFNAMWRYISYIFTLKNIYIFAFLCIISFIIRSYIIFIFDLDMRLYLEYMQACFPVCVFSVILRHILYKMLEDKSNTYLSLLFLGFILTIITLFLAIYFYFTFI